MDENKNYDNEEIEETAEETADEAVEQAAEDVYESGDDVLKAVYEAAGEAEEPTEAVIEEPEAEYSEGAEPAEIKKGSKAGVIIAVIVAVVVIAAAMLTSQIETNKYNKMGYVNISGKTLQDIVDEQGMELSEFLETYELPADMPGDTYESAAYYQIPVKKIAEMYGMDFETLKTTLKLPDTVTETTTWGEAEGEVTVGDYIGTDNIDDFKTMYGLGDEVTAETKWKDVRKTVDEFQMKKREESEKQQAEQDAQTSAGTDSEDTGSDTDAQENTEE